MDPVPRRVPGRLAVGAVVTLLVLLLTGCGGDDDPAVETTAGDLSPSPTATEAAPSPSPPATPAAPFPADTEEDTGEPAGAGQIVVADVQVSGHDGFDRVTFTIQGDGTAGWEARYTDDPRSQGTGDPVAVTGEAVLEMVITNAGFPDDVGADLFGDDPALPDGLRAVRDVVNDTFFEGRHLFFVGVDGRNAFRVRRLDDPQRVVLEIVH